MKSVRGFAVSVVTVFVASSSSAWANFTVPEPGTWSLVGIAAVGAVLAARFFKK